MRDLFDRARLAVAEGRDARRNAMVAKQDAIATSGEFKLLYDGYSNGVYWGRFPNGGRVPVQPISPGTIEIGQIFVGTKGKSGAILANWMP